MLNENPRILNDILELVSALIVVGAVLVLLAL